PAEHPLAHRPVMGARGGGTRISPWPQASEESLVAAATGDRRPDERAGVVRGMDAGRLPGAGLDTLCRRLEAGPRALAVAYKGRVCEALPLGVPPGVAGIFGRPSLQL